MIEYVKHLNWILDQLKWVELKIKVEKCEFVKPEIKLLSHWILAEEMIPDLSKVAVIKAKFENCWILKMDKAWKKLKKRLIEAPIFRHLDFTKLFILYINISKKRVNAILA